VAGGPRPLMGRFMVPTQGGSVLCTKFEADSSFHSKGIRVPKFRNWVNDPGHAHLGVVLHSIHRQGPSSISVPNLKNITFLTNKEDRSRDLDMELTEGQITRPYGPSLRTNGRRFSCSRQNMIIGSTNTTVLPDPVNAMPIISRPDNL